MAIPASHIVTISPRTVTGGSSNLELNGLFLTKNELISTSTLVVSFSSATAVGDYFGTDSLEYQTASNYFTSYDNKYAAPSAILFARRISDATPAWLRGGAVTSTLEELQQITNGYICLTIDGTVRKVSNLNFSTCTSYSAIANLVAFGLANPVAYSSLTGAFTIETSSTGSESSIGYPVVEANSGTNVAEFLCLREADGAVISAGMDSMDEATQMEAVRKVTENWVSFTTFWEPDADEALAWAKWASNNYGWLYVPYTCEETAVSMDSSADIASQIMNGKYDHVACVYGSLAYAAFLMGCVASIPWNRTNGAITVAFKSQSGLAALVTDETTANVLEAKNCNYYGIFATRNSDFAFLYPSKLSASDYGFIDPYVNSIWLNNRLQVAIMDGLKRASRVPYSDRGYTMIRAWMMDPVNEARNNGVIEQGIELSEAQKSELYNEAGEDISDTLWTQGYFIQILDPGASVRAERGSPIISLWYTYGGAVHKIDVASTVVL